MTIGEFAVTLEQYYPAVIRRNFAVRLLVLASVVVVGAPAATVVFVEDVLTAAVVFSVATILTGFLAYCELYWVVIRTTDGVRSVDDGEYDLSFAVTRPDEIGVLFDAFERMATSLEESLDEAEAARERAAAARKESQRRSERLESRAAAYADRLSAVADGDLRVRLATDADDEAMREIAAAVNDALERLAETVGQVESVAAAVAERSADADDGVSEVETAAAEVADAVE